ncbi:MAG: LytR C-terminal domain-containing protein [Nitriliruptoraceae bacterium]
MAGSGSNGVRASLLRNLAAAVGLVLVVSAAFTMIGSFVEQPAAAPEEPTQQPIAPTDDPSDGAAVDGKLFGSVIPRTTSGEDPTPSGGADGPDAVDDVDDARIDPATIRIQVLDGYRTDGGTAAGAVTDELEELGYEVPYENSAIAYDVTTVLWNEGHEAEARQVAEDIEAGDVRVQPGNLDADVMVHVVVGADRG